MALVFTEGAGRVLSTYPCRVTWSVKDDRHSRQRI